ncbi:YciI family protein [Mycobacterium sp.]|uniref:YciI family protein n=1 Tax=Mycobacterium sp. TaxID=1785 RepID=UPI003D6B8F0E
MRYMMIMRSTPEAQEAAKDVPFDEVLTAMGKYNESLIEAGVMLAGEGLAGPEEGFVVDFSSDPPAVSDEPYGGALFNGFWILGVSSRDEAQQWASRCPLGPGSTLEVRRVHEVEDLPQDNEYVRKEIQWRAART